MSSQTHHQRVKTQTGAVLVVSLLFLVLMMLIGLTGMQVTSLEEKMSGNMRDRNLAFQAAESALRAGELTVPSLLAFPCASGLYRYNDKNCDGTFEDDQIWDTSSVWSDTSKVVTYANASNLASLASGSPPAYIIEEMPFTCDSLEAVCPEVSKNYFYRVTARATGGTTDAIVQVQSIYKK
jgi:type IV pilus assembly protein PilX